MGIEALINQLAKNPAVLPAVEQEVERLVSFPDLSPLQNLQQSSNPAVTIYLCKILELRIKRKVTSQPLDEEIAFVSQLLQSGRSFHVCDVYSLLGLLCWPMLMPSFLTDAVALLAGEAGYQLLLLFLEKVNGSTDIDDKRRSELKKAIGIVAKDILPKFQDEFAELVIPIFTELTKILPPNYDYSIVFRKGPEYPELAIAFFSEATAFLDHERVLELLAQLPSDAAMIQLITDFKFKSSPLREKAFEYVFRGLVNDSECFIPAVDFWQKVFSAKENTRILDPVLTAVTNAYLGADEELREEAESYVFGFFSIVGKNYPAESVEFLKAHEAMLPTKIVSNFLHKIARAGSFISGLSFQNVYLACLACYLRDDPQTPTLLDTLDLGDKDSVKLALLILRKYEFGQPQLLALLKMCEGGCLSANELQVECLARLGVHEAFEGDWNMDKVIKFYYFLKLDKSGYSKYADSFYALFIQNAPFDRCFAIVAMLGDAPAFILESIYDKLDAYPHTDLGCFNNDLLPFLSIQLPFVEKEVRRFIGEWAVVKDYREYYQALRSLLGVFSARIEQPGMADLILELVQIDCSMILNRVLAIFNNYKGRYSTRKAVYYFISAYNSPGLGDSQALLSAALAGCLYQEDGAQAFSEIMLLDISKCCNARVQMSKCNRKTAHTIVRNLLKDFKGKALNKLFENDTKVTKQNFLSSKPAVESDDE